MWRKSWYKLDRGKGIYIPAQAGNRLLNFRKNKKVYFRAQGAKREGVRAVGSTCTRGTL